MGSFLQIVGLLFGALGVLMLMTFASNSIHEIESRFRI
jgi:hypothetical protein